MAVLRGFDGSNLHVLEEKGSKRLACAQRPGERVGRYP